jgi:hypothetical protein
MKKILVFAALAAGAMLASFQANASLVTLNGSTAQGDSLNNITFSVDDTTHEVSGISGAIDVVGQGLLSIGSLLTPTSAGGFIFDGLYDPADAGPTPFSNGGIAFNLGSLTANLFDDIGLGGFIFAVNDGTGFASSAYYPGHVVTSSTFTTTVPEPSTLALMGLGLIGFAGVTRRTKKIATGTSVLAS